MSEAIMQLKIECDEIIEYYKDELLQVDNAESPVCKTIRRESRDVEELNCMKFSFESYSQNNLPTSTIDSENDNARNQKYVCVPCDNTFNYSLNVGEHIETSHVDYPPFLCIHCGELLSVGNDFKAHGAECNGDPFRADTCLNDSIVSVSEVTSLVEETCRNTRQFICTKCDKKFSTLKKLNVHQIKCKDELPQGNECALCDLQFICPDDLKRHRDTNHREHKRLFQCSHCGKTFSQSSHLSQHIKQIHFGERSFICTMCDKTFAQSSHLKLHIRHLHSDERPYACAKCNKRFPMVCTLQRHELVHSGEKPYMCALCQKLFRQLSTLRRHEATHERYHKTPL